MIEIIQVKDKTQFNKFLEMIPKDDFNFVKGFGSIRQLINQTNSLCYVHLKDQNTIVGFIFCALEHSEKYLNLINMYISDSSRKQGISTHFLEDIKNFSRKNNCDGILVKNNDKISEAFKRLLIKLGWHLTKSQDSFFWKTNYNPKVQTKYLNKDKGFGVFAVEKINKGELVLIGKSVYTTKIRDHKTLQISDVLHSRLDVPFENTNHNCNPNTGVEDNEFDGYNLVALRNINAREEITMDYCMTEWTSVLGDCFCNSDNCRGQITGAKDLNKHVLEGYENYIANYIKEKI